ncbi:hypothetical protein Tco_0466463 [Tanacetum coccineum]
MKPYCPKIKPSSDTTYSDSEKTDSYEDENPNLNQNEDKEEECEYEYVRTPDSYGFTDDDEEYEELYKDVNVRLKDIEHCEEEKEDEEKTDAGTQETTYEQVKDDEHVIVTTVHDIQKTEVPLQRSSISFDFATQFLNLDNPSPADTKINSMMNIDVRHEEPSTQIPPLLTIPVTVIPETSSAATSTIPPPIPPFTPILQTSTPTPAPTTKSTTTSIPALPDFSSLFEFDQRVSVLEKEVSQLKQVDYSAQLLKMIKSQILAMVDAQLSTRLEDSIQKDFRSYTTEFEKKAKDEKKKYIDLVEKSVKEIIKDEVKSQLLQIQAKEVSEFATLLIQSTITKSLKNVVLAKSSFQPKSTYEAATSLTEFELKNILLDKMQKTKEVSEFATPVIQSTITKSLENVFLAKSSSQPKSTYEAATSLTEFELKKILLDKMHKSKSYRAAQEHRDLYDALVKSYKHDKDLFESYGKEYSLKRDREDKDKD